MLSHNLTGELMIQKFCLNNSYEMYTGNWKIIWGGITGTRMGMRIGMGTGPEFAQNNARTRTTWNSQLSNL